MMARATEAHCIDGLYAAAAGQVPWSEALETLADHAGAAGAFFIHHDFEGGANAIRHARLREDLIRPYFEEYALNPYTLGVLRRGPSFTPCFGHELAAPDEIRRSAFHTDILAPMQMADHVNYVHAGMTGRRNTGGISVTLDARRLPEQARIAARFARLTRHMSRALDLFGSLSALETARATIVALVDRLPGATMILDADCTILHGNARAEHMLARDDGLGVRPTPPPTLRATLAGEQGRLIAFLRGALDGSTLFTPALRLARPGPRSPLLIVLTPLRPQALLLGSAGGRVLVQVLDPDDAPLDGAGVVLRSLGLTAAEARVAVMVAVGQTTPMVADRLGISVNTVRTHLSRAFEKTGCRTQSALARLVAHLDAAPHPIA
jgi:DNA-binding CsgD family transcriptional regulator